jgi:hypothetical protein
MASREIQLRRWENHRKIMVNILDHPRNIESMDWFKGKFTGLSPMIFMGKSMVSGVDFPLNQSIDCPKILKPTRRKSMEKPMYQW